MTDLNGFPSQLNPWLWWFGERASHRTAQVPLFCFAARSGWFPARVIVVLALVALALVGFCPACRFPRAVRSCGHLACVAWAGCGSW